MYLFFFWTNEYEDFNVDWKILLKKLTICVSSSFDKNRCRRTYLRLVEIIEVTLQKKIEKKIIQGLNWGCGQNNGAFFQIHPNICKTSHFRTEANIIEWFLARWEGGSNNKLLKQD